MPSRFEPCGLNQMYSMRYGTVPIVHHTGGLADTVKRWDGRGSGGTGFVFRHFNAAALKWAIERALYTWGDARGAHAEAWRELMLNGMRQDFSWTKQAKQYELLYRKLRSE
jgi:starch synthase